MRIIAQSRPLPRVWRGPEFYERQRIDEMRQERCHRCDGLYPSSVMAWEDGRRRCPNCVEIRGRDELERIRGEAFEWIAEDVIEGQPFALKYATEDAPVGVTVSMTVSGVAVTPSVPLYLTRGAAATTLVLAGHNFSTADTVSATSGITVAVSSRTATQTDLSVQADVGATPGDFYSLTFNGTTFRNIFRVR
jgi:hypothetical protein